jgi:hypothetical protein
VALAVEDEASSAASFFVGNLNFVKIRWLDGLVIAYGILLIAAGIHGYLSPHGTANPMVSLITRSVSGAIAIGLAAYTTTNPRVGRIGSAVLALLIFGHTGVLYLQKGGVTSLVLCVASLIVVCCLLGGHFAAMKKRKSGL